MLGPRSCARVFPSCGKRGPLPTAVRGPLTIATSCCGAQAPDAQAQQLRPRAQPLRGTRDPPRPGREPASPALAGRLPTTAPPGKPPFVYFCFYFYYSRRWIKKDLAVIYVEECSSYVFF